MMQAGDINETWFNPAFVVSLKFGDYRSMILSMADGKEVIVPKARAAQVYKALTGEFWK